MPALRRGQRLFDIVELARADPLAGKEGFGPGGVLRPERKLRLRPVVGDAKRFQQFQAVKDRVTAVLLLYGEDIEEEPARGVGEGQAFLRAREKGVEARGSRKHEIQ